MVHAADRYGFALLMPEQTRSNNPNGCFNWFQPEDAQRAMVKLRRSIRWWIRWCATTASIRAASSSPGCRRRRHDLGDAGLLSGTFVAGAIIAGLPYGAASNVQQAFQSMFQCPSHPAKEWGDLVRAAAPRREGSWPRVSVWHGNADKTVIRPTRARSSSNDQRSWSAGRAVAGRYR